MFIVTGCQRSGTTLLGIILQAHKDIEFLEENISEFQQQGPETIIMNFPACLEYAATRPKLVGFKAPRDSHRLFDFTAKDPNLKVLWMQRPAVQVVASMLKFKLEGMTWAKGWAPREIRKHIMYFEDDELAQDFERAQALTGEKGRDLAFASLCWRARERHREVYRRRLKHHILDVDYVSLVQTPEIELKKITAYLGISWDNNLLHHQNVLKAEKRPGASSTDRPIDTSSLYKWQGLLNPMDLDVIADYSRTELPARTDENVT